MGNPDIAKNIMKSISIVTVVLNYVEGLKKTYESIKNQTVGAYEWIVIDGGSKDGLKQYMELAISTCHIPINYVHEVDNGIYDAMNKGIMRAKGDYTLFLNAGDILHDPKVIEKLIKVLHGNSSEAIYYGNYCRVFSHNSVIFSKAKSVKYLKHGLPTSHQAILYPSRLLKTLKYNLVYEVCSDYYITAKAKAIGAKFEKVNITVTNFYVGGFSQNNMITAIKEIANIQRTVLQLSTLYIFFSALRRFINMSGVKIIKIIKSVL